MVKTIRKSLAKLTHQEIDDFFTAWERIKALPPSNPNSLWSLGSFHGQPFKERKKDEDEREPEKAWNSYCPHMSVLFPIWHRYYCLCLEHSLQTAVPETALHYWDQTDLSDPVPEILYKREITLKLGVTTVTRLNPLIDFTFPLGIKVWQNEVEIEDEGEYKRSKGELYHKPFSYTTKRYPFSGVCYPSESKAIADAHNANVHSTKDEQDLEELFVRHIRNKILDGKKPISNIYINALHNPDYNTFSNRASLNTKDRPQDTNHCLEVAHDLVHVTIGGFTWLDVDKITGEPDQSLVDGEFPLANGDMGFNETAAYDPIFWLHHCNVDRLFWIWQKNHNQTEKINIRTTQSNFIDAEPGATPNAQGPTIGRKEDDILDLETVLYPFQDAYGVPITGKDCCDIAKLGYEFTEGSLEKTERPKKKLIAKPKKKLQSNPIMFDVTTRATQNTVLSNSITVGQHYDFTSFNEVKEAVLNSSDNIKCYMRIDIPVSSLKDHSFIIQYHCREEKPKTIYGHEGEVRCWFVDDADYFLGRKNAKGCENCEKKNTLVSTAPLNFYTEMTSADVKVFKIHKRASLKSIEGGQKIDPFQVDRISENRIKLYVYDDEEDDN